MRREVCLQNKPNFVVMSRLDERNLDCGYKYPPQSLSSFLLYYIFSLSKVLNTMPDNLCVPALRRIEKRCYDCSMSESKIKNFEMLCVEGLVADSFPKRRLGEAMCSGLERRIKNQISAFLLATFESKITNSRCHASRTLVCDKASCV